MIRYRVNASGSMITVKSWPGLTGTGSLSASGTYSPAVFGTIYCLYVTGTVTVSGSTYSFSGQTQATCP